MKNKLIGFFVAISLVAAPVAAATQDAKLRAREFVVMGYNGLMLDLKAGDGPYLRTLIDILGLEKARSRFTVERLRALADATPNIMDFADKTVELAAQAETSMNTIALPEGPHVYRDNRLDGGLRHLTRGTKVTVYTSDGGRYTGSFDEYEANRLWLVGAERRSFSRPEILAIEAPAP